MKPPDRGKVECDPSLNGPGKARVTGVVDDEPSAHNAFITDSLIQAYLLETSGKLA